jgi:hypothetical protein
LIHRKDDLLSDGHAGPVQQPPERAMSDQVKPYPIVEKAIDMFGNWLKHRRAIREIHDLDSKELAHLAQDLCMTPADLDALVRQGPQAIDQLPELLNILGLDQAALSRTQPLVLRDMKRVCASCQQKARCNHDRDAGTLAKDFHEYCPNAPTIEGLAQAS